MPNTSHFDIETLIAQFTTDLTTLVRRTTLEEVLATLQRGMNGAAPRRGPGRPHGPGRPKGSTNKPKPGPSGRIRRSSEDLAGMQDALLSS